MSPISLSLKSRERLAAVALAIVALAIGWATASDYGLSWDEPYFYAYADAVPYAYSIQARLDGTFDIENAYGPSAEDHKVYGPVYLLVAKPAVELLQAITHSGRASTWHFVNFSTFLLGAYLLYDLCRRWLSRGASLSAAALFVTQPLLWGHGFINPKDIPFMTIFLGAVTLGLKMVDRIGEQASPPATSAEADTIGGRQATDASPVRWAPTSGVALLLVGPIILLVVVVLVLLGKLNPMTGLVVVALGFSALVLGAALRPLGRSRSLVTRALAIARPLPVAPSLLPDRRRFWVEARAAIVPGLGLGAASCMRVLGPAAGALVLLYYLLQHRRRSIQGIAVYLLTAAATIYMTWPFLWDAPLARFWQVVQRSANNPAILAVLFRGEVFQSNNLPGTYLPVLLGATLSEPVLLVAAVGMVASAVFVFNRRIEWRSFLIVPLWLFGFLAYVMSARPPMYDGFRHFLFLLPPLFVFVGVGVQAAFSRWSRTWVRAALVLALLIPSVYGILETHPYEYAYYNQFVGRMPGAFRRYELDYWLTCYKQTLERFNSQFAGQSPTLYVFREYYIADAYAAPSVQVLNLQAETASPQPGDYVLLSSRTNEDQYFPDAEPVLVVGKNTATLCLVKRLK